MELFLEALKNQLTSEVRTDAVSRQLYSVDASIYELAPLVIVIPRSKEELIRTVQIAFEYKVPITARGAATGITGGCLGSGLVIDCSKFLNSIVSIDYEKELATIEPGVIQDQLNMALSAKGYRLGPDTSTGNRATLGGMVANNATGAHALKFGRMVDHVEEVELILASGETILFKALSKQEWQKKLTLDTVEGQIYRDIEHIKNEYSHEIATQFPKIQRRASGYNLDELIKPDFCNISKLITGSEGTLGIISQITVKICKKPVHKQIVLIASRNLLEGIEYAARYNLAHPYSLEMIDRKIIEMGRISPLMQGRLSWLQSSSQFPDALFAVEFEADSIEQLTEKCCVFKAQIEHEPHILWIKILSDEKSQDELWQLRKSGLGLLLSKRSYSRAIAFIEDIAVPVDQLAQFTRQFSDYLKTIGKEAGIYGHIGDGCLHIRPYINMKEPAELALMQKIMLDVGAMVKQAGGVLSAEHGDGLVRSWMNPQMFGEKIYKAFQELKEAFDLNALMNPGKIAATAHTSLPPLLENLRLTPETPIKPLATFFDFSREGGIELAADLCNGNGQCRKKEGVMCPSFQVTNDEKDSTRARANALRSVIHGKIEPEMMTKPEFYDVMDLCIQCKGCKTECPSQVDMAKMKAEYLYQYHTKKGFPLRSYLFGHTGRLYKIASLFPRLANFLLGSFLSKKLLSLIGVTEKRTLPKLGLSRFSKLFANREKTENKNQVPIVLFSDTFTEFTAPHIGMAATTVLEKMGYAVIVPEWQCCGRTLISKGFLPQAKEYAEKLVDLLYPYAVQGIVICGLEPSCLLTIRDEFRDFHLEKEKIECVASMCKTIDEVIAESLPLLQPHLRAIDRPILFHSHCHQKALVGSAATLKVLQSIPKSTSRATVEEIASGCCGMAGSFGYESEHYEFSLQIGSLKLFPAINQHKDLAPIIVANGTSCRCQIQDGCHTPAIHLVELITSLLPKIYTLCTLRVEKEEHHS